MIFSKSSKEKLSQCDINIQDILNEAIEISPIDFGVSCGYRSPEEQLKVFEEGKSQLDGYEKKSNHNYSPSKAVDVYAYVDGKASWSEEHLSMVAGVILSVANKKGINIGWGGFWKNFKDLPHFELKD